MSAPVGFIEDLEALWRIWAEAEVEALTAKKAYLAALDHAQSDGLEEGGE